MTERVDPAQEDGAASQQMLVVGALVLGVVTQLTTPGMAHFAGALIPWPSHGITVALLIAASTRHRRFALVACALALTIGLAPASDIGVFGLARLVAAVALLVGQALFVTWLYELLAGRVGPLSGTTPYAWMLVAVVVGTLPLTAVASAAMQLTGIADGTGYSGRAWWIAASTSGATLVGPSIALLMGVDRSGPRNRARVVELAVIAFVQLVALVSAFAEIGPLAGRITPALAALPFLAWGGLRSGIRGYAVIAALLIVGVLLSTWADVGPFGIQGASSWFAEDRLDRFRRAWIYVASLVGPAMIFPVAFEERAEADRRTRSALAQLRSMFESTGDLIAAVDRDLTLIAANSSWLEEFEALSGVRPQIGSSLLENYRGLPLDTAASAAYWQRAVAGERFTVARELGDPARRRAEFEITYAPVLDERQEIVGASQIVRNITERRRRESAEAETRRLESIGRLAGGVAHDFNNLMTAVLGYSELLAASMDSADPRRGDVAEIQRAATRAGELTQQLLAFARRREVRPRVIDVAALLEGMDRLIHSLVAPKVRLEFAVATDLPAVLIDPTQFEQVVMNLAVNARDAMPEGGLLRLEASVDDTQHPPGLRLTARDTGSGMAPDVMGRMFEPFYTTKALGKGTGLGLATVHGIVHQAKGRISVESTEGVGTTITIHLPAAPTADLEPTP
ncbi:MAG: PAS domain-containing protein [Gemmatimonadetes bacterium]|nr:PAS domain-containing protein [Gemmatimonadota bacterium]